MESRQDRRAREEKHFKKKAKRALGKKRRFDDEDERDARKVIKRKLEEQENELYEENESRERWEWENENFEDEDY